MFFGAMVAAVFFGNCLTLAFVWGLQNVKDVNHGSEARWLPLMAIVAPPRYLVFAIVSTGWLPPSLDALIAQ